MAVSRLETSEQGGDLSQMGNYLEKQRCLDTMRTGETNLIKSDRSLASSLLQNPYGNKRIIGSRNCERNPQLHFTGGESRIGTAGVVSPNHLNISRMIRDKCQQYDQTVRQN